MANIWVLLASILSSGVIAAVISASLTDAKEKRILRRLKIEEIYLNAAAWLTSAEGVFLRYLRVCEGVLTYNQVLDMEIAQAREEAGTEHLRMKMNIEMYEHSLIPVLRAMESELRALDKLRKVIRDCYDETGQATEIQDVYRDQLLRFGRAGDDLKIAIIRRGSIIARELGLIMRIFVRPEPLTERAQTEPTPH